jgi:hypothetical protein
MSGKTVLHRQMAFSLAGIKNFDVVFNVTLFVFVHVCELKDLYF